MPSRIREVDGVAVVAAEHPADEVHLSKLLSGVQEAGQAVVPVGGGTHLFWGNPPRAADVAIYLTHFDRIISHEADDLLVTVQAGCPFQMLQQHLAMKNQWIPLDPCVAPRTTIGGLVATNSYGPSRLGYGRIRDYLIGIEVVHADGIRSKAGGRVVKNVAGYDLTKLYVGSLGWLGIFTQFHFKTVPRPEFEQSGYVLSEDLEALRGLAQKVLDEGLAPVAQVLTTSSCLMRNGTGGDAGKELFLLLIKFAEHPEAVRWQWDQVSGLAQALGDLRVELPSREEAGRLWRIAAGFGIDGWESRAVLLKAIFPFRQTSSFVAEAGESGTRLGFSVEWLAYAGAHVLWMALKPNLEAENFSQVADWLETLRRRLSGVRGELILARAPRELKEKFEVWGVSEKPLKLMQAIKHSLDPKFTFNPGRYVGRL